MIIIVLITGVCVYIGLYILWATSQSRLSSVMPILALINHAIFAPQHSIFVLMRILLVIIFAYVTVDFIFSSMRRKKRSADSAPDKSRVTNKNRT